MATADDYLKSPKWVEKFKRHFTMIDRNKNGYLSMEDYMAWPDTLKKVLSPDPQDVERLRQEYVKLATALGAKPGAQLTQEQFLKATAEFLAQLTQEQFLKATAEFLANCNEERRKILDDMSEATYAVMENKDVQTQLGQGRDIYKV